MLYRFVNSTYGKGIMAIRDDEIAAEIMSVNTQRMKLTAFMLSSGLAGVAGGLFAHILGYINPGSFTIMKSTEVMVMVYLGGMGSLTGSVLSAVSFTILMELLRPLQVWKWVLIPLVLIILMMFRPEGIMGHRELTDIFPKLRRFFPKKSDLIRP
jgi:branched-chain amino acid transport system permease protein